MEKAVWRFWSVVASTLGAIPAVNLMTIVILLVPRVTNSHYNNLIHGGNVGVWASVSSVT